MQKSYDYFISKISELLNRLLVGEGTAKQRLLENEDLLYRAIRLEVPPNLRKLQVSIIERLSKKPQLSESFSSYRHTLSRMRNSTASKIIYDINLLFTSIKED